MNTSSTNQIKLSVAIATFNEEANIQECIQSIKNIADEIIVVDGQSTDETVEIAKKLGAIVKIVPNQKIFHINKQIAFDHCQGTWILNLDADEIVGSDLAREIKQVVSNTHQEIDLLKHTSFLRHMNNIAKRDNVVYAQIKPITGYFIARKNYFLGHYLMHSAVYPDGVIRLFKNGCGYLPSKDVHEQIVIKGGVSWLGNDLIHMADPTFSRYITRANRYTSLTADRLMKEGLKPSFRRGFYYMLIKPTTVFLLLFFRHKGFLDGFSGFVWSLMSGLHWPLAYIKFFSLTKTTHV